MVQTSCVVLDMGGRGFVNRRNYASNAEEKEKKKKKKKHYLNPV